MGNKNDSFINEEIGEEISCNFAKENNLLFKLVCAKKNSAINSLFKEILTIYLNGPK